MALVAVGASGAGAMAATNAPLSHVARAFSTRGIGTVVAIGGVTAMLGVILSQLLGLSRMAFAMSRRGDLPGFLQHVHPRYQV